ncbi:MAG: Non-classical phosphatidylinositol transfer protein (PITP) [Geoglossum umbratile]|nr:MAG: Non-classical phosphatidylinositol transfer protein (PITP) [Geoglossum umbratile]
MDTGVAATEASSSQPAAGSASAGEPAHEKPDTRDARSKERSIAFPEWPPLAKDHPITKFETVLPAVLQAAGANEIWGFQMRHIETVPKRRFQCRNILQKFLRANANNVDRATHQLIQTLTWRSEFEAAHTAIETFDKSKFEGVGYVTTIDDQDKDENNAVITWNIYGSVKDNKTTFGDVDEFLRWRVALMEMAMRQLNFTAGRTAIPDYGCGDDPYQIYQVHDYLSVRFFTMDASIRASSKRVIEVFRDHYPEMLARKFFVNVPVVMGWVYASMKLLLPTSTTNKFTFMSYGNQLAREIGEGIPEVYGGKGPALDQVDLTPKLGDTYSKNSANEEDGKGKAAQ